MRMYSDDNILQMYDDSAQIIAKQITFQRLVGFDILDEDQKLKLSETYVVKAAEECFELRKTFPSFLNQYEKVDTEIDRSRMIAELVDVLLFLINFCLVWRISIDEIVRGASRVQANNFDKLGRKLLKEMPRK